jgi:hypothetical protein
MTTTLAIRAFGGNSEADGDGQSAPLAAGTYIADNGNGAGEQPGSNPEVQ